MSLGIFLVIGAWQYIIIGVVVLLLFGGKKIPELMKGLGSGIKEFKDASKDDERQSIMMQITRLVEYLQHLPLTTMMIENIEADDTMAYITKHIQVAAPITIWKFCKHQF